MPSKTMPRVILFLIFVLFAWGVLHLFELRFKRGDIYPPYSTFRSDPLGCRVLHDALVHTGERTVTRNRKSLLSFHEDGPATLVFLGDRPGGEHNFPQALLDVLNRFLDSGGRIVICQYSNLNGVKSPDDTSAEDGEKVAPDDETTQDGPDTVDTENPEEPGEQDQTPDDAEDEDDFMQVKTVDLFETWGFDYDYLSEKRTGGKAVIEKNAGSLLKSGPLPWHSTLLFKDLSPEWRVMARYDGSPVLIERPVGNGSLVLFADSYLLSNEGLKNDPRPDVAAYLMGRPRRIIIDETHLGIQTQPGVGGLLRKYGLHGVMLSLMMTALLFIWKNASFFVPPRPEPRLSGALSDRDYASGLSSLFKRHIPPKDLLSACVVEWGRSFVTEHEASQTYADKLTLMTKVADDVASAPVRDRDPLAGYRKIQHLLSEGKTP